MKRQIIIAAALGIGATVAVTGLIGFIGLAAPHIIRLFAGADHRIVLPGSALLGAPFFLWLLGRYRRELL